MSFKKAVFFGGAVLVLAACGDATSPTSPSALKRTTVRAALMSDSTTTTTPTLTDDMTFSDCGNATIHLGEDGSIMIICEPTDGQ